MQKLIWVITLLTIVPYNLLVSDPKPVSLRSFWLEQAKKIELKTRENKGLLDILSYNTWGLPVSLAGHDQRRRFNKLPETLMAAEKDIVCLQETFHPSLRYELVTKIEDYHFDIKSETENRSVFPFIKMDKTGGLMTLSKYPVIEEVFYQFPIQKSYSLIERVAQKGFLLTKIQYGPNQIYIINTHMYAGDNALAELHRLDQMKYMAKVLNTKLNAANDLVILMGDLNIHHPNVKKSIVYDFLTKNMGYHDSKPVITKEDFTIDHCVNKYVPRNEIQTKLDYVFLSPGASCYTEILGQSREMVSENPLSDHFGWAASLRIGN